jgi:hypothetical protein
VEFRNLVRTWNNVKNFIIVRLKLQLCQLEIPIFIYKIMCQSTIINTVAFLFGEFIRVTSWNDGMTIIYYDHHSNSQTEILVSYSKSTNIYVNMFFPNSKFIGNFSTFVFGKSFWHYRELKIECWISRHLLCEKILNYS